MDLLVKGKSATVSGVIGPIDRHMGHLLVDAELLEFDDIERILTRQRRDGSRFGEAAIALGLLKADDIFWALSIQYEYPQLEANTRFNKRLVIAQQPLSARAESIRDLRSQLLLRWFGGSRKLLAVTAARNGEGCSEVAANLALSFAQLGEKTLLIDADMRSPMQETLFGLNSDSGLSNLLAGRGSFVDAVQYCPGFADLSILGAGAPPPNPQELLSRATFVSLLNDVIGKYDIVLLDTPPAMTSADAQFIAAIAGGSLHVVRRHQSRADDLKNITEKFSTIGINLVGAVIVD